ncbi:MAG: type II secretion system protein [Candidatus Woesebacteria bacterium]
MYIHNNQSGVTLIELLVVMAIFLIIGVSGTSYYARFFNQNSVANTTDHLIGQLRKAQLYSLMSKQGVTSIWGVRYTSSPTKQITLFLQGNSAFDENYTVNPAVTISSDFEITFAHVTGIPTPPGPTDITISGVGSTQSITLNTLGVVSKN